jgi:biotin transport system substrate-specific component
MAMTTTGMTLTLTDALWPASTTPARLTRAVILALAGSLLLTVSAKIQIPFWPVPMTMQTFVVLVLGMAYGWKLAAATLLLYLAEGAFGLPVFAGTPERGIGIAYMVGATGGYLAGFLAGAALCGWLAERGWDRSWWRTAIAMSAGHLLILALGWAWLATLVGPAKAFAVGVAPFYAATVAKTALAVLALPLAWKILNKPGKAPSKG